MVPTERSGPPAALVDGDTLYLWFAGHVLSPSATLGVGLATLAVH